MNNLNDALNTQISSLAKEKSQAHAFDPNRLETSNGQCKRIEHELSQYVQYAKRRCLEGFDRCIEAVYENQTTDLHDFDEDIKRAFERFDDTVYVLDMVGKVAGGTCWKELLGLSDKTMTILYEAARKLYDSGRYPEAEAAFYFLTMVDVSQYGFWIGLGHAAFRLANFNQSINAYETASLCKVNAVWPHIYIANCYESMSDYEESLLALTQALNECKAQNEPDQELENAVLARISKSKKR